MAKINLLDSSVYNKISAGEVVERPASVVKELIENAIDSGAQNITIEIENGGIDVIKVRDDGCGIENDDIENAFKPHATSKIVSEKDLININTMGFRGEALASIASVAQVEILSKNKNDELGIKLELDGGVIKSKEFISIPEGTNIIIRNLFYNVPARKKFLKKPKLEENYITDIVSRLIMTYPNISFSYSIDGVLDKNSRGVDLVDAIFSVYGKQILDNIYPIESSQNGILFSGYIGKPIYVKPNRTYQTLILNNRYIQNSNISFAVQRGYENYLMKGKFPFYVLNIQVPNECVDVNVHPQKMEVRIENDGQVFSLVYKTVQSVLLKNREIASFTEFGNQFGAIINNNLRNEESTPTENTKKDDNVNMHTENSSINIKSNIDPLNQINEIVSSVANEENIESDDQDNNILKKFNSVVLDNKKREVSEIPNKYVFNSDMNSTSNYGGMSSVTSQIKEEVKKVEQNTFLDDDYKILSTLFNTYILIEQGEDFIMIDQHAGHERLLFEQLKQKIANKTFQSHTLLVPFVFEVTSQENEILNNYLSSLKELGFSIVEFGRLCYKIDEVPFDDYIDFNCKEFIDGILNLNYKSNSLKENFNDFLALRACKCAVKGGDVLSKSEIEYLINQLKISNTPMFCPHGRPIAIKFSKKEVEKWFKRII